MSRRKTKSGGMRDWVKFNTVTTLSSGVGVVQLDSQTCDIFTNLSSVYRYYRFTRVKVKVHPFYGSAGEYLVVLYYPEDSTIPAAIADGEMKQMALQSSASRVPQSFTIAEETLRTPHLWRITEDDASEASLDRYGDIWIGSTNTSSTISVLLEFVVSYEYREPMESTIVGTLEERIQSQERKRDERRKRKIAKLALYLLRRSEGGSQTGRGGHLLTDTKACNGEAHLGSPGKGCTSQNCCCGD